MSVKNATKQQILIDSLNKQLKRLLGRVEANWANKDKLDEIVKAFNSKSEYLKKITITKYAKH